MITDEAVTLVLRRLHDAWCPHREQYHTAECAVLIYGLFRDDPENDDLMLGFPLGLS